MRFDTLADYSAMSGVGVVAIDDDGTILFSTKEYDSTKNTLGFMAELFDVQEQCKISMIHSCYQASRYGGRYIFVCPRGFLFFASPVVRDSKRVLSIIGGPVLMTGYDDYIEFDVKKRVKNFDINEIKEILSSIPVADSEKIATFSEQLLVNAAYISDSTFLSYDTGSMSDRFDEYVASYSDMNSELVDREMLEDEQKLIEALSLHDEPPARALLNDILGQIIFHSGKNLELVKSRILELIILLSRAAIRDGADPDKLTIQKQRITYEINNIESINEIVIWLNDVLDQFTNLIFKNPHTNKAELVKSSMSYIKKNYDKRLTLEDVARYVHISPSYMSKLFKEETGFSFKGYLNMVRIEESKLLLQNSDVNMMNIASLVGFEDQSYFTKVFKKYTDLLPNQYRSMKHSEKNTR